MTVPTVADIREARISVAIIPTDGNEYDLLVMSILALSVYPVDALSPSRLHRMATEIAVCTQAVMSQAEVLSTPCKAENL